MNSLYKTIRIKEIKEEVKNFKTFVFEDGHNIQYKAGQYITLVQSLEKEEIRRSYSIISSPVLNEPLAIGVKRKENGFFSRLLIDHAKPGDELITTGAGGFFVFPENIESYKQIFLFAAGSGITPIFSLLKTALHLYPHLSIILVDSNTSPASTIFLEDLLKLKNKHPDQFELKFLFSIAPELIKARLHRELLIELLNLYAIAEHSKILFYICGPLSYMRMCTYLLQELHVPAENIKKENFIIDQPRPPQVLPFDKETHNAVIHFNGKDYSLPVYHPDSILQAAKKHGITLPYSCETGRCGNCVAQLIRGRVWLSYNEVLSDKDLAKGLTLTCVGHPVGGDVELKIS
jgi:ferredoxin-NADP reductase